MDLPTLYGTRLLSPFDWHWYAADLMPIVDVYLLVVLAAGLALGWARPQLRRQTACLVLAFMAVNYAVAPRPTTGQSRRRKRSWGRIRRLGVPERPTTR